MEKLFDQICEVLFSKLQEGEYLTVNFGGEKSQFIRYGLPVKYSGGMPILPDKNTGLKPKHSHWIIPLLHLITRWSKGPMPALIGIKQLMKRT